MAFSAKDIQELRQVIGAGILDCRRALEATDGDVEAAKQWLREQGLASAGKRAERESAEGAVAAVVVGNGTPTGAIVELRCETDFVAKSPDFVALVDKLSAALASDGEEALTSLAPEVQELNMSLKENISIGRTARFAAAAGNVLDSYLHIQAERGKIAVLVELANGSPEMAHDIAIHISFAAPQYLSREDVPADVIETERKTIEAMARNEGKSEAAIEKIIEGRLRAFFKDVCLLEQGFVRDDKQSVEAYLGEAKVVRYARVGIGS